MQIIAGCQLPLGSAAHLNGTWRHVMEADWLAARVCLNTCSDSWDTGRIWVQLEYKLEYQSRIFYADECRYSSLRSLESELCGDIESFGAWFIHSGPSKATATTLVTVTCRRTHDVPIVTVYIWLNARNTLDSNYEWDWNFHDLLTGSSTTEILLFVPIRRRRVGAHISYLSCWYLPWMPLGQSVSVVWEHPPPVYTMVKCSGRHSEWRDIDKQWLHRIHRSLVALLFCNSYPVLVTVCPRNDHHTCISYPLHLLDFCPTCW